MVCHAHQQQIGLPFAPTDFAPGDEEMNEESQIKTHTHNNNIVSLAAHNLLS
jgi:hypothetical protein